MKNKIFKIGIIAVIATVAFLNVNVAFKSEKSNSLAEVTLTNVETLAYSESAWDLAEALARRIGSKIVNGVEYILDAAGHWIKKGVDKLGNAIDNATAIKNLPRDIPCTGSNSSGININVTVPVNGVPVTVGASYETTSPYGAYKRVCDTGGTSCTANDC